MAKATYFFTTPDGREVSVQAKGLKHAQAQAALALGADPAHLNGGKRSGKARNGRKPWKPGRSWGRRSFTNW